MRVLFLTLVLLVITVPDSAMAKRKIYMQPQNEYGAWFNSNVTVTRSMDVFKTVDARRMSPNEAYWFTVSYAMVAQPDRRRLDYAVHIDRDSDYFTTITLFDVLMEGVPEVRWLNDKLLYIEFWWRKDMGAYIIFDVENEYMVARDMIFTDAPRRMPSYRNFQAH